MHIRGGMESKAPGLGETETVVDVSVTPLVAILKLYQDMNAGRWG